MVTIEAATVDATSATADALTVTDLVTTGTLSSSYHRQTHQHLLT